MQSSIRIGRRADPGSTYIGRPTPLGNPFELNGKVTRDEACDKYDAWLTEHIAAGDSAVVNELARLKELYLEKGYLILGCYCSPWRCHGESIKRILDRELGLDHDSRLAY